MYKIFLTAFTLVLFLACKKTTVDQVTNDSFRITILPVKLENFDDYQITGTVEVRSAAEPVEYGIIFGKSLNPTLENSRKVIIGKTSGSADFKYRLSGLDTGAAYYMRAYVLGSRQKVDYSANQAIGKISPTITPMDTALHFGRNFSVMTNLPKVTSGTPMKVFLNDHQVNDLSVNTSITGTSITAPVPASLQPGKYMLSLTVNNLKITHQKKLTLFEGTWTQVDDLPSDNGGLIATGDYFVDGDWIYSYKVHSATASTNTEFFRYNYKTQEKVTLRTFDPVYRLEKAGITKLNGKLHFICGNWTGGYQNAFATRYHYVYDIASDQWTKEDDFPGGERIAPVCMSYDGKLYYGMGYSPAILGGTTGAYYTDMWCYEPGSKTWRKTTDFPRVKGRGFYSTFQIRSGIYFVSGVIADSGPFGSAADTKEMWCFDASSEKWNQKADYPGKGQLWLAAFSIGNYGYAGMGESRTYNSYYGKNFDKQIFKYNPLDDRWTEVSNFGGGISQPLSGSNATHALVGGGANSSGIPNRSLFVFKP